MKGERAVVKQNYLSSDARCAKKKKAVEEKDMKKEWEKKMRRRRTNRIDSSKKKKEVYDDFLVQLSHLAAVSHRRCSVAVIEHAHLQL